MAGSLFDKAKKAVSELKKNAPGLARQHSDTIDQGIDRVAAEVDKRTGRKHADKIHKARQRAKDAVDDLAASDAPPPRRPPESDRPA
jgi:hypothetical protein